MTSSPRELTFVFQSVESALAFHRWTRSYFAGSIGGAGSQLLSATRVKLQGIYAGEPIMFAREAAKTGGVIELQPLSNVVRSPQASLASS